MRLRFTIRDLLWLMVVVALAVGWWLDHRQLSVADERAQQRERLIQLNLARDDTIANLKTQLIVLESKLSMIPIDEAPKTQRQIMDIRRQLKQREALLRPQIVEFLDRQH
jgi:hypothetical protein